MFTDTISVNDGTAARTFTRISSLGLDTVRSEDTAGVSIAADSQMAIKHQKQKSGSTKPNRHLVSFTFTDMVDGAPKRVTVHAVITRDLLASDVTVQKVSAMLVDFLSPANVTKLCLGGN